MAKEPFLMNPHLGIINPQSKRKKKGKKSMARRKSSKAHMAYVRSFRKGAKRSPRRKARRARKSNPWPMAGMVVANPRRKRRTRAVSRRRSSRRHSYSRNPRILGIELPPLNKVLFAGVGFMAPPMVEGLLSQFIPAEIQTSTLGKYAVRIAAVLALTFGVKRFVGKSEGDMVLIGGGVYVASTAAMEFLPNVFGGSHPAVAPTGVSSYVAGTRQLSSYVPATGRIQNGLGLPSAAAFNRDASGAFGGTASRFKRF